MPWIVLLSGHNFDLEELPKWLEGGEFRVVEEEGSYRLVSEHFERLNDPSEVRRAAEEVIELINGLGRIQWSEFRPVSMSDLAFIGPDGQKSHHAVLAGMVHVRSKAKAEIKTSGGATRPEPDQGRLTIWMKAAAGDERVQRVVGYLNRAEITWNDLYRALEVVESDVGSVVSEAGWAPKGELKRFSHTANSFSVLGYAARHGHESTAPPSEPMTFQEARSLILRVVHNWIDSKVAD